MHGLRLARHGDVNDPGRMVRSQTGVCTVQDCGRKHLAKGFCDMHYQRVSTTGSPGRSEALVCERCAASFERPYKGNPNAIRFCSHECRYANQLDEHHLNYKARYAYLKLWRQRNPHLLKATLVRRQALKAGVRVYEVTGRDLKRLIARFNGMCAYCRERPYEHLDHVLALSRGGRHAIGNLLPACAPCNLTKAAKLLAEWRFTRPIPRRFRRRKRSLAISS